MTPPIEPFRRGPGMHGQGMQTRGEFPDEQPIDEALPGEGLEVGEAVTDHEQAEVGLTLRWGIVLMGFVHQLQMQGG